MEKKKSQSKQTASLSANYVHAKAFLPTPLVSTQQQPSEQQTSISVNDNQVSQSIHMNAWYSNKGLHITHLNIHFLYPKLDEIKVDLYDLVIFDHFWPSDWRGNRDEF